MSDPFSRIERYYDDRVDRYGHDFRACDYGRAESQQIKFEVLSSLMPLAGCKVLDVGCGFADYAAFLEQKFGSLQYVGIDLSPRMIAEAKRLRPDLDLRQCNLLSIDAAEGFDVVSANGIFYLLGESAPQLMRQMIARMFEVARRGVALNSLSTWAPDQEPGEFYADPLETVEICRSLTSRLVLRHDYHSRDFTIYLYK